MADLASIQKSLHRGEFKKTAQTKPLFLETRGSVRSSTKLPIAFFALCALVIYALDNAGLAGEYSIPKEKSVKISPGRLSSCSPVYGTLNPEWPEYTCREHSEQGTAIGRNLAKAAGVATSQGLETAYGAAAGPAHLPTNSPQSPFLPYKSHDREQILHRDLKPENTAKSFKLTSFGLAKISGPQVPKAISVVDIKRGKAYDETLDIYGMGCLLFEISTLTSNNNLLESAIGYWSPPHSPICGQALRSYWLCPALPISSTSLSTSLTGIGLRQTCSWIGRNNNAKLDLRKRTRAFEEQRKQLKAAEQESQKKVKDSRNAEKAFRRQREDQ
ncbi:hypothetical protein P389DRAFT_182297 [Cystobasidium minutum MCA 4210]|uniref:uncharacterized protein n=1 Tax=Cystobasidium minutum MCA 4210 TaxID=1397322 RepID=UPI0034CEA47F|eukprot:jgi/Rhomi1/182297/fgenesh1_pg.12_\